MVNNQFEAFCINLNAQHVNGMTHVKLGLTCTVVRRPFLGISNIVNRCLSFKPAKQKKVTKNRREKKKNLIRIPPKKVFQSILRAEKNASSTTFFPANFFASPICICWQL